MSQDWTEEEALSEAANVLMILTSFIHCLFFGSWLEACCHAAVVQAV